MPELFSFLIVILAGVVFSAVFNRLHLPWVIALIIGGIAIGPNGLGIFAPNETIDFLAEIGLVFLMFMAGLETRLSSITELKRDVVRLFLANALIPFGVGVGIGILFGFQPLPALLLGIVFIGTSIAVVVPAFEKNRLLHNRLGKTVIGAAVLSDVLSLTLLSLVVQKTGGAEVFPAYLAYPIAFTALVAARWAVPLFRDAIRTRAEEAGDLFEQELRGVFVVLIALVLLFQVLGLHSVIAGFLAGLVLSDFMTSERLREKLHALSYGLFIPIFFVVIGTKTNLAAFGATAKAPLLVPAVLIGAMGSKFISGWFAGRWIGFSKPQSSLIGVATTPQLITTLAAVAAAGSAGLLEDHVLAAMVILSIVTTFAAPLLIRRYASRADPAQTPALPTIVHES